MAQRPFDRYIIQRELGRGGMATVYLAYDPRFERHVALKVLPHALLHDLSFRERFDREAKIIASLEHQAIVPVYDYGEHQGQPFLAMRLMRGGSLKDRLKHSPLSLPEAHAILARICAALDKAHAKKIVHRDLKPDNILFDEDGAPYLADFGIAKIVENTQSVTFAGTYQYMAPEQAHGDPLDRRTDVYQMGVVLFETLTGCLPFQASTPAAFLHQHAYAPVPSVRALNASLPPECDAVIAKAMAKNKHDRFATASQLATALATLLTPKATPSRSQPNTPTNKNIINTYSDPRINIIKFILLALSVIITIFSLATIL